MELSYQAQMHACQWLNVMVDEWSFHPTHCPTKKTSLASKKSNTLTCDSRTSLPFHAPYLTPYTQNACAPFILADVEILIVLGPSLWKLGFSTRTSIPPLFLAASSCNFGDGILVKEWRGEGVSFSDGDRWRLDSRYPDMGIGEKTNNTGQMKNLPSLNPINCN